MHITDAFLSFAARRQRQLRETGCREADPGSSDLEQLLLWYPDESDAGLVRRALLDPYFPLGMLAHTLFADVGGMRFYINKRRTDLGPVLTDELRGLVGLFVSIRLDIETYHDPDTITCVPLDGRRYALPNDQWCSFCGICCQVGGVPATAPAGILYPDHWLRYLAGDGMVNQQSCPFLFQLLGEPLFFCSIHSIKPLSCRAFGEEDCRNRLGQRGLHAI